MSAHALNVVRRPGSGEAIGTPGDCVRRTDVLSWEGKEAGAMEKSTQYRALMAMTELEAAALAMLAALERAREAMRAELEGGGGDVPPK